MPRIQFCWKPTADTARFINLSLCNTIQILLDLSNGGPMQILLLLQKSIVSW